MNIGSKLSVAKTVVTSKAGRQLLKGQKHSPTLLFGAGVIGVVATAVMASKATLKLEETLDANDRLKRQAAQLLESIEDDYTASDYTKDMAQLKVRLVTSFGKLYAPAVGVGIFSICALTGSHVILTKRNTGLMAAYATLDKGFNEYRARVLAEVGPEKALELQHGAEKRDPEVYDPKGPKDQGTIHATGLSPYSKLFSPQTSANWSPEPDYNHFFLRSQQAWMNDMLNAKGHVFLNEVYDCLGLERTSAGAVTGWVKNNKKGGDNFIDFGIFNGEDRQSFANFFTGSEDSIWLDFNVDGVVYDLI
jgi:hypothetical protein